MVEMPQLGAAAGRAGVGLDVGARDLADHGAVEGLRRDPGQPLAVHHRRAVGEVAAHDHRGPGLEDDLLGGGAEVEDAQHLGGAGRRGQAQGLVALGGDLEHHVLERQVVELEGAVLVGEHQGLGAGDLHHGAHHRIAAELLGDAPAHRAGRRRHRRHRPGRLERDLGRAPAGLRRHAGAGVAVGLHRQDHVGRAHPGELEQAVLVGDRRGRGAGHANPRTGHRRAGAGVAHQPGHVAGGRRRRRGLAPQRDRNHGCGATGLEPQLRRHVARCADRQRDVGGRHPGDREVAAGLDRPGQRGLLLDRHRGAGDGAAAVGVDDDAGDGPDGLRLRDAGADGTDHHREARDRHQLAEVRVHAVPRMCQRANASHWIAMADPVKP
jgi:hypothetical protein